MNSNLLKYLVVFGLGILSGFWLYAEFTGTANHTAVYQHDNQISDFDDAVTENQEYLEFDSHQPVVRTDYSTTSSDNEKALLQTISQQQTELAELQLQLEQLQQVNQQLCADPESLVNSLETISVEDLEKRIELQLTDRFKGLAVELKGKQLEDVRNNFEGESMRANWNADYENNINHFIHQADPNGLHFVDELSCNRSMCRLKVQSSEIDSWKKLYLSMTRQSWYKSMTLVERSEDPSIFVYYIPKPQDI